MKGDVEMLLADAQSKMRYDGERLRKEAICAFGAGSGGLGGRGSIRFAQVGAHDDEEFGEFEGFAEEEAGLEAHAMELPIVAAGDDDDGSVTGAVVAAQDFIEGSAVEVGEADVKEYEVWMKWWYSVTGDLAVVKESELPVWEVFEGVAKEFSDFGVVFDDDDTPEGWAIVLQRFLLYEIISHVYTSQGRLREQYAQVRGRLQGSLPFILLHPRPYKPIGKQASDRFLLLHIEYIT